VLRSAGSGTNFVHQRLNAGRAITLCWSANKVSSPRSTSRLSTRPPTTGPSMLRGTNALPTKPMA
jgi:hypothetical protein